MIFECNCLICRKQSLNNTSLYWKKINKSEYLDFVKKNKIYWKRTSFYASRGFNSYNEVIIIYYIWNMCYIKVNNGKNIRKLPLFFKIFTSFLNFFNVFWYNHLDI